MLGQRWKLPETMTTIRQAADVPFLRRVTIMELTQKQRQLAQTIDRFVTTIEKGGGGDAELLTQGFLHLATFKELMDMSPTMR